MRTGKATLSQGPALDPIITMNAVGIIQSASESVQEVFGWTPSELFGRNVKVLIPEPRRSALDRYLDRYRNADRSKSLHRTGRFQAIRKDGSMIPIELSMSRADLPLQRSPYFIGIIRDVSKHIDTSAESKGDRSRLQLLVTEQTRALANANLRLQLTDRLASLGTLAAGLGHDMNNVLLPVRAHLNALEHAGVPAAAASHVKALRRSIAYLQHLSDGLHFLALDPDVQNVNGYGVGVTTIAEWWNQVGMLLRKAVPKSVTVRTSLAAHLPAVKIAPHWLTQAVLNLMVNAGESFPAGRRRPQVHLWAELSEDGSAVRLGITDNGRGMSSGVRQRAMDLFFTTKARGMGTGLGLPMVYKVIVRAGGEVEITSAVGRGTTVVVSLPVAVSGKAAGPTHKRTAVISVHDHRATVLISQILTAAGVHVVSGNGLIATADLWITDPTDAALGVSKRRRRMNKCGKVVLVRPPSKRTAAGWASVGARVIDPPNDFEAMRTTLGHAIAGGPLNATTGESP
ncbi:MAG TPA: PAS domain S-box protein [Phycisphaerales bacterium]|nr:PAS domain S-box protein [Phycisphaerales bacterium]